MLYIYINDELKGKLMNDESITFEVERGTKILKATDSVDLFPKKVKMNFVEGHEYHVEVYYSAIGPIVEVKEIKNV